MLPLLPSLICNKSGLIAGAFIIQNRTVGNILTARTLIVLIIVAYRSKNNKFIPYVTAGWAFVFGNMHAMLFTQLDPIYGSCERIGLLIIVKITVSLFLIRSIAIWKTINQKASTN